MNRLLQGYSWDMGGYTLYTPQGERSHITQWDARHAFSLVPKVRDEDRCEKASDYIARAKKTRELKHVFIFMSENEQYFNRCIENFCVGDGMALTPEHYLDMKLACREVVLEHFQEYDKAHNASFLTYLQRPIADALLRYRMTEEAWSIGSLTGYKRARMIAAIYRKHKGNEPATLTEFCQRTGYSEKAARKLLDAARIMRRRYTPTKIDEELDEWESADELFPDNWDYVSILYDGMEAELVDQAFQRLSYREQTLLERRNAICMRCGRVSHPKKRASFQDLAIMFEGSTSSGAERAYRKAVEKLTLQLVKLGALHCVRFRQKTVSRENKKVTAATYEYLADHDGDWGTIQFDFVKFETSKSN